MTAPLITSLEQAGEGSLADLIDRLTLYEHREGYDGKDWEKIASEAAEAIRALAASTPVGGSTPGGWLVKDFADGWYWTGDRLNADMSANGGACVFSIETGRYETDPPPSVSTGSRPQEAVPTEGHGAAVVSGHTPECWGRTSYTDEMAHCYCPKPSEADKLAVLLDNLVIAQGLSKEIRQHATDEARSYLYDLRQQAAVSTTSQPGTSAFASEPNMTPPSADSGVREKGS